MFENFALTFENGEYTFDNGRTVIIQGMPPAPVVWVYNTVDMICGTVGWCRDWRRFVFGEQISPDSWWSDQYRVPSLSAGNFPPLLSYADFYQTHYSNITGTAATPWGQHQFTTWDALYRYAFATSSTALGDLSTPTAFGVLLVVAWLLRNIKAQLCPLFSSFGRRAAILSHGKEWVELSSNQIRITKFGEYVFRLLYHATISVYGLAYFWDKEWWQRGNTVALYEGYPLHEILPGMAWYYILQAAYNVDALISLLELSFVVKFRSIRYNDSTSRTEHNRRRWQSPIIIAWSPTVRGDFDEMFAHHIVTNVLVIGSSYFRLSRIGSSKFRVLVLVWYFE